MSNQNGSPSIEHSEDFINNISQLFHRPELSDLTLVIEDQEVKVNRSILAARSQYFHALLYNGMKETCLTRIVLSSAELKSFRLLLKFIYSGRIHLSNLNTEEIADLLVSARFFCFEKLACDIASYLKMHINKSNVWLLYKVSKSLHLDQLAEACDIFFDQNAEVILQQEEFFHLELEELKHMINRDSFFAPEETILRAICNYYRNNTQGKPQLQCSTLFKELIEPVRLSLISPQVSSILAEFELSIHDTRQRKESARGYLIHNKNIATEEYKVEAIRGRHKKVLFDSSERNYNIRTSTNHTLPNHGTREEYIQVAFGRPFIVNNIRMLLLDDGQRSFSYTIEVSVDGRNWTKIIDYSKYWCRSWQHLFFKECVVKHVRITGKRGQFYGTGNSQMSVVYFDCMYNTLDSQMYNLTEDNRVSKSSKKPHRQNFVEPKTSVVELANNVALSSSTSGTMRHFRLRAKASPSMATNSATSSIPTSSNAHSSPGPLPPTDNSNSLISSNPHYLGVPPTTQQSFIEYRTTDFARGSANWTNPGKITFQLAQPFKIGSFAFRILPLGSSTRSHFSYSVSISNDLDKGSWKTIREVTKINGKELTVVEFEPQIVTFIEIRSLDYPTLSQFSVKNFECPYLMVGQ